MKLETVRGLTALTTVSLGCVLMILAPYYMTVVQYFTGVALFSVVGTVRAYVRLSRIRTVKIKHVDFVAAIIVCGLLWPMSMCSMVYVDMFRKKR